ncbi:MAG TPA: tetratricopeptide repeat protein [Burkholderiaceae bacterium]|nr:tetratricopeptide repeat protein [Burkholderiaceae bacterium]HQR70960.1 tetratricopeptide repeat protein [Burkholderiaceae bacterium]
MRSPNDHLKSSRRIIANALRACTLAAALAVTPAFAQPDAARAAYESEDYATAVALYAPRATAGDAEAQYRMGMMARFGWGMDKDTSAAVRWLTEAARQNHPQAQAELGTMYRLGRGVPEDPKRAAQWLTAAANAGVGIAQLSIGRMYRDGIGVDRDLVEAYAWFSAAGENSVMDGFAYRSEITKDMTPEQIAEGRRRAAQRTKKETENR